MRRSLTRRVPLLVATTTLASGLYGLFTSTAASADETIDGCTIVSSPTPADFTNCPNQNLAGANFFNLDLSYADFQNANLTDIQVSQANLADAELQGANLTNVAFQFAFNAGGLHLSGANLTGSDLIPEGETEATSAAGRVYQPVPEAGSYLPPGITFDGCDFPSDQFPVGVSYSRCAVTDAYGQQASGTGSVTVYKASNQLSAQPAIVSTSPTPGVDAFQLTATLTFVDLFPHDPGGPSGPISGAPVSFEAGSQTCDAVTDANGVARCDVLGQPQAVVAVITDDGYTARYAGTTWIVANSTEQSGLVYAPPLLDCGPPLGPSCPPPP